MTSLTVAEALCMALFCSLLGPTLGLSSLQGLNSGRTRRGLLGGKGGLLGGVLGGGDKGGGGVLGDVLGGILGGGDKGGGGGGGGGGGVLGGVLGGGGKGVVGGVLGGVGGLVNNATGSVLPGAGVPVVGDVLGGVLGGGGKGGGGVLGGVLGGGDKGVVGGVLGGVGGLLNNATGSVLPGAGVPVVGDVLGGVLGGGGKGGGGVLGGVLGGGDKGVVGGVLGGVGGLLNNATGSVLPGGRVPGVGGLLGGDGGKGGGFLGSILGDVGGLLNETTNSLLASGLLNGVLDQNQLRDLLGSLNGNLLGLGSGGTKESLQWYNILNLQFIRGSWKIIGGTELILNLQAMIVMKLPVLLFRTVTMDVNITAHLAITQDKPGDLKLVLKNCQNLVAGFTIKMPSSLIATLLTNLMNLAVQNNMPRMLCPIFQIWINIINMKLRILNNYVFFGLLGRIHTALSTIPISTGQFSELDLKDKPFPGFFLNWLLNDINSKVIPKIA